MDRALSFVSHKNFFGQGQEHGQSHKNFSLICFDHHAKFGCCVSYCMDIDRGPQKFRDADPTPFGWVCGWPPRNMHLSHVTVLNFVIRHQTISVPEKWAPHVPPFTVTQGHWNGHWSINFLFKWSIVTVCICHTVSKMNSILHH